MTLSVLGPMVYGSDHNEVFLGKEIGSSRDYSEKVAADIDSEVRTLIETGYAASIDILKTHIDQLHLLAKYLLIHEKIDRDDFEKLMSGQMPESAFEVKKSDDSENKEDTDNKSDIDSETSIEE